MKKAGWALSILIITALVILPAARCADTLKIGFVNAQRIIEESKTGKDAYAKLKNLQDEKKKEVEAKKAAIDKSEEELRKQYLTLSEDAKRAKEEELTAAKKEFKRMLEDADADLGAKEKAYLEKIDKDVMEIIQKYGKDQGFTLILGKMGSAILYSDDALDVTDKIIEIYDKTAK